MVGKKIKIKRKRKKHGEDATADPKRKQENRKFCKCPKFLFKTTLSLYRF
jgi:hypothetical protein